MTSEQARELFSDALDDELDADARAAFERALHDDAELAREYAAFRATLQHARGAQPSPAAPDLLAGVQRRLRQRSRGRFYGDRFSERLGRGLTQPLAIAVIMLALLALAWFGLGLFEGVTFSPPHHPP
jgi:anti-sigma factor RsiW